MRSPVRATTSTPCAETCLCGNKTRRLERQAGTMTSANIERANAWDRYRVRTHESMLPPRLLRRSDFQIGERFERARGKNQEIISLSRKEENNKGTNQIHGTNQARCRGC